MSSIINNEDLIERFVLGELKGSELQNFERSLLENDALRTEVQFQKSLVNAIQAKRKADLKAHLDTIKIASPYSPYLTAGISSAVVIGSVIFFSMFWPFENEIKIDESSPDITQIETEKSKSPIETDQEIQIAEEENEYLIDSNQKERITNTKTESLEKSPVTIEEKVITNVISSKVVLPQTPEPETDNTIKRSGLETLEDPISKNDIRKVAKVEVEIKADKDYNFHYQYYNSKLFLYGDFSKSPYELIELNTNQAKELYMFFNDKYYALENNQLDIKKLSPIRDKIIIKGLDNLR